MQSSLFKATQTESVEVQLVTWPPLAPSLRQPECGAQSYNHGQAQDASYTTTDSAYGLQKSVLGISFSLEDS